MTTNHTDRPPLEQPLAGLERQLASRYASEKLSEIEARAHYVRTLHGEP